MNATCSQQLFKPGSWDWADLIALVLFTPKRQIFSRHMTGPWRCRDFFSLFHIKTHWSLNTQVSGNSLKYLSNREISREGNKSRSVLLKKKMHLTSYTWIKSGCLKKNKGNSKSVSTVKKKHTSISLIGQGKWILEVKLVNLFKYWIWWQKPAHNLKTSSFRKLSIHSFGVIWIKIRDPRSVWLMVHQRGGLIGSFDAPWSRQIWHHKSWSRSPQWNAPSSDLASESLHFSASC